MPAQIGDGGFHRARGVEHDFRRHAGLRRGAGHVVEHARLLCVACAALATLERDVARRGALLLDRGGDAGRVVRDLLHALGDAADRFHGARGRALHRQDLSDDRFGRFAGLHRQRFDFRRDHGKAASRLAGARRFDRGIERQQVGLLGDGLDELDDVADLLRRFGERGHFAVGRLRLVDRHAHDIVGLRDLARDLGDRTGQFVGGARRRLRRRSRRRCEAATALSADCEV